MNVRRQFSGIIGLVAIVSIGFLNYGTSAQRGVNINKMIFARGYVNGEAKGGATSFAPKDHDVYCIVGISNPSPDAKYRFVWSYIDNATNRPKPIFEQSLDNQTSNDVVSKFSSSQDLPLGRYKVELYINDKMRQQRNFYVSNE